MIGFSLFMDPVISMGSFLFLSDFKNFHIYCKNVFVI